MLLSSSMCWKSCAVSTLLLPNMLVVCFMVVSLGASTRAWCLMSSDLEGDQAGENREDAQVEDGVGTAFLYLTFWGRAPSKNPCPDLVHPSSCRRHPLRVPPDKDEDVSFRHPRLGLSSPQPMAVSEVAWARTALPFQGSSPPASADTSPREAPCSMNIPS